MKKLIAVIMAISLFFSSFALADIPDISGLSYDELVQLRDQINIAMWNSQEWQEVIVPAGTWKVGEDIPAGHWSISMSGHGCVVVWYCEKIDELGKPVCFGAKYTDKQVASEDFNAFGEKYSHKVDFELQEGWYLYFTKEVIFSPYSGKPDLGFK